MLSLISQNKRLKIRTKNINRSLRDKLLLKKIKIIFQVGTFVVIYEIIYRYNMFVESDCLVMEKKTVIKIAVYLE